MSAPERAVRMRTLGWADLCCTQQPITPSHTHPFNGSLSGATHLPSPFSAFTLLVRRQEGHAACKKLDWWGAGVVICLERGADLHMAQLMPLPLTVSCFSKIQTGFAFLVPAHMGSPGQRAIKQVCVVRDYPGEPVPER